MIYDNRLRSDRRTGCCCHCGLQTCCCCFTRPKNRNTEEEANTSEEAETHPSLIHRILDVYYQSLHRCRWPLLVGCAAALVLCAVRASQIELPVSADVRLFDESDNQYEANYMQRQNLLFDTIESNIGSNADVIWGVLPADTGNQNNPDSWTKLVLDHSFEPSNEDVQVYLRDFCDELFATDFARPPRTDYQCPLASLDAWLKEQSAKTTPESIYTEHCAGANALPIPEASFDNCAYAWSQAKGIRRLLARQGKIEIITMRFGSRVSYESPQDVLDKEWNLINVWMTENAGPEGSGSVYFTSEDFWWYDTNGVMLETACKFMVMRWFAAFGCV